MNKYFQLDRLRARKRMVSKIFTKLKMDELQVDFDRNVTPLYKAISDAQWDKAIEAAQQYPEQARTWVVRYHPNSDDIMWRFLPIHSASAKQPPENVINALISAYRRGAQSSDDQGMLPLHYACGNQASIEVLRLLLLANPEGSSCPDPNGMMPLHYLSQWGPDSSQALDVLLFANRDAAFSKDNDGCTPLDLARYGEYPERDEIADKLQQLTLDPSPNTPRPLGHQPSPINGMVSIPNASDPVRRLQEAAASQEKARQEFMRGGDNYNTDARDDEKSIVENLPRITRSFSSRHDDSPGMPRTVPRQLLSLDDSSQFRSGGSNEDAKKMVEELKAKVERLRSDASMSEAEADKRIAEERTKMQAALDEMKAHLVKCEQETQESLSQLAEKEQVGQLVESRLEDKENDLKGAMSRNEDLRKDLDTVKRHITAYKTKTTKLDRQLSTLTRTMEGMLKEQEQIMKASFRHEQHMKKVALARQQKMQELIDQEVQFARSSFEKQKQNELGSEESINEALEKQKQLMSSIQSVLSERCN